MSLFLTALLSTAVFADDSRTSFSTPDNVHIDSLTYGGSGCPQGTLAAAISPDRTTFTLIFDSFVASSGQGIPITQNRRNCQVNTAISYPQGWSYSILSVDYRGYASLPAGVTATQKATYYFSGEPGQVSSQTQFQGPYDDDYLAHDAIAVDAIVWSPCGAQVNSNINAQVRLSGNSQALASGAEITVDSIDGKVKQIFGLQWRRC